MTNEIEDEIRIENKADSTELFGENLEEVSGGGMPATPVGAPIPDPNISYTSELS